MPRPVDPVASDAAVPHRGDLVFGRFTSFDVILTRDGHLFVDDEDEFEQHRLELGYPPDVVSLAERTSRQVIRAVGRGTNRSRPLVSRGCDR